MFSRTWTTRTDVLRLRDILLTLHLPQYGAVHTTGTVNFLGHVCSSRNTLHGNLRYKRYPYLSPNFQFHIIDCALGTLQLPVQKLMIFAVVSYRPYEIHTGSYMCSVENMTLMLAGEVLRGKYDTHASRCRCCVENMTLMLTATGAKWKI